MPPTEGKRPVERGAIGLAALAGASAWISLGTVAVLNLDGDRIGALPSIWLGVGAVVVAAAIAWAIRLETVDAWPLLLTSALWFPWLPWPVPASLLIWEGPLEALIWTAAIGGVVASGLPRKWTRAWPDPRLASAIAGVLVLACSIAAAVALRERIPGGDEPHYLVITQSLLRDGDLQIANNHRRGDYLAYYPSVTPPDFLQRGTNGEIYSIHAPGLSLLLLPAFAVAGYAGAVIFVALLCAGAVVLFWRSSYALTSDAGASWAATLAVAFGAPFFLHTFAIFPDPVGAVIVSAAVALLVRFETAERVPRWHLVGVGAVLSLLPWLHTRFSIVAGTIACCVALRLWHGPERARQMIDFLVVPLLAVIAWLSYFWIIYGTPDPTAPYGNSQQNAASWIFNGLTGLLFDQQFGLLANAPVLLMALVGAALLWRERPRLVVELVAIAVPYLLVVSSFAMWWGGWSAPGRFAVTVLPLAVPPLSYAWLKGGLAIRLSFVGLLLVTLGVAGARVLALDGRLLHNERNGYDVLLDWASPAVNLPLAMPAVHRAGWPQALLVGAAWIVVAMMAIAILDSLTRTRVRERGARWALACGMGLIATSAAMTLSMAIARATPLTPESSKVSFLSRWDPRVRPTIVDTSRSLVPSQQLWPALALRPSNRQTDRATMPVLFAARQLPAGDYRIVIEGQPWQATTVTASIGGGPPLEAWRIVAGQDPAGLVLRLPAKVQSLSIRSDDTRSPQSMQVVLEPLMMRSRHERVDGVALSAARYEAVAAFFFDDRAYVEPAGLWTRAHAVTDLLVTAGDRREVDAGIQAGPVATAVQLRSDDWSTRVELSPGERRVVAIPAGRIVSIATAGGFRPIDHDPGVRDERPLGVRIEFK